MKQNLPSRPIFTAVSSFSAVLWELLRKFRKQKEHSTFRSPPYLLQMFERKTDSRFLFIRSYFSWSVTLPCSAANGHERQCTSMHWALNSYLTITSQNWTKSINIILWKYFVFWMFLFFVCIGSNLQHKEPQINTDNFGRYWQNLNPVFCTVSYCSSGLPAPFPQTLVSTLSIPVLLHTIEKLARVWMTKKT